MLPVLGGRPFGRMRARPLRQQENATDNEYGYDRRRDRPADRYQSLAAAAREG
jgi:hypothetical protein